MQFISPQNDFAFKRIFGNEQHKEILISFLNSVLDLSGELQVVEVELANPYQVPRLEQFKETILDINATCQSGRKFIVEMQIEQQHSFHKRALYYSSKAYVEQLSRAEDYPRLKPVYFIGVLNFKTMSNSGYLSRHMILDSVTHEQYFQDFEFCLIELPKFAKHESEIKSIVDKWIFFLKYLGSRGGEDKDFARIFAKEPQLLRALEIARYHSLSRDELSVYEYQEKRRRNDAETARTYKLDKQEEVREKGREEGREEGLEEGEQIGFQKGEQVGLHKGEQIGLQKGLRIAARTLAKNGLSVEAIARELEIDITQVRELLQD